MMTEQERALLMALGTYMCGSSSDWAGRRDALAAAYERAAQPPAEPKPSGGVNEEISLRARNAFYDALSGWNLGTKMEAMDAFTSAAPYITAAKDAELAAVIRDNDAKTTEIEKLKSLNASHNETMKTVLTESIAMDRELRATRNPDINAAADAGLAAYHGTYADSRMQWRAVARAILKR